MRETRFLVEEANVRIECRSMGLEASRLEPVFSDKKRIGSGGGQLDQARVASAVGH